MVSIIVTHKKDVLYLKDCLESIALQQFKEYETILVIDHSEDKLDDLIDSYKDRSHLSVFYLEEKAGVSAARNLGLEKAQGEYIYFLDNDDYLYGESIKQLLDVMDKDSDMAYGVVKHTWFQRLAFHESQGEEKEEEENTILPSDFALYQETVPAGVTENTILLFQVPDSVTSVDSLDLFVNISGTNYQITL